jgi:hypothetical protein
VTEELAQRKDDVLARPEKDGEFDELLYSLPMRPVLDEAGEQVRDEDGNPRTECAIQTPELQRLYVLLTQHLKQDVENHGGTTLEYMLAERVVYTLIMIRDKEVTDRWVAERYHKETTALYADMQSRLQRTFEMYDRQDYRDRLLAQMGQEIQAALASVPKDVRIPAGAAIGKHLEAIDFN